MSETVSLADAVRPDMPDAFVLGVNDMLRSRPDLADMNLAERSVALAAMLAQHVMMLAPADRAVGRASIIAIIDSQLFQLSTADGVVGHA